MGEPVKYPDPSVKPVDGGCRWPGCCRPAVAGRAFCVAGWGTFGHWQLDGSPPATDARTCDRCGAVEQWSGRIDHRPECHLFPRPYVLPPPPKTVEQRLRDAFDELSWRIKAAWRALRHGEESIR